ITGSSAALVVLIFAGVIGSLVIGAMPSIKKFGFGFLTSNVWNPVTEQFGAAASIYGTVVTSFLAMVIAVPVGIGIELLAGIPSIIYGIWGLFVFAPAFQQSVQPWLIETTANIPVLKDL